MYDIELRRCKRSDGAYQEIRSRHYIPNRGAVGQQIHYLIILERQVVGIISGGAAAYAVKPRDEYFGINKDNRNVALNGIVDNTVFRLEKHLPNLGTQVLSMWRKRVAIDWQDKYGVKVCGFETFIIEQPYRKGSMYKADNWDYIGETSGTTKVHLHGIENKAERTATEKKLIFCKRIVGVDLPTEYYPTWNTNTVKGQIGMDELFNLGDYKCESV